MLNIGFIDVVEKADNERRAGELEEAKKIQQSMLPKVYPKICLLYTSDAADE